MLLFRYGVSDKSVDRIGRTIFHMAVVNNMGILVRDLIHLKKVDINAKDYNNMRAIDNAIELDNETILMVMVY